MSTPQTPAPPPSHPGGSNPELVRLLPGAVVLVLGLGFLLNNLGMLHFRLWCLWPLIFVAIGLVKMARSDFAGVVWGLILVALGVGLTLDCFGLLPFRVWQLWPVLVIGVGAIWLWSATHPGCGTLWPSDFGGHFSGSRAQWEDWHRRRAQRHAWRAQARSARWSGKPYAAPWWAPHATGDRPWWAPPANPTPSATAAPAGEAEAGRAAGAAVTPPSATGAEPGAWLQLSSVFSGVDRHVTWPSFRGATITAFFGGVNLDLRGLGAMDHPVMLDVHAVFGGVEIYVPSSWHVSVEGAGIFGAFDDQSRPPFSAAATAGQLIVRGEAVFGGVVVKN